MVGNLWIRYFSCAEMHVSFYIQKGWQFYSDELVEYSEAIEYSLNNSSLFSGSNNEFNTV